MGLILCLHCDLRIDADHLACRMTNIVSMRCTVQRTIPRAEFINNMQAIKLRSKKTTDGR